MKQATISHALNGSKGIIRYLLILLTYGQINGSAQEIENTAFTLSDCVKKALENNPLILASGFRVEESRAMIVEARAGLYPSMSCFVSGGHTGPESRLYETRFTGRENWNTELSLSYTVFRGFKTLSSVNAAKADWQASEAQHEINRQALILNVTDAYYRLLQSERMVKVAEQSMERARMHLDFSNARFEAGLASRSDILKATVEHSDARLALIRSRNARLSMQGQLNIQMGRAVHLSLKIIDDLETDAAVSDTVFSNRRDPYLNLLQIACQNRSELRKIEKEIQAQKEIIRSARGDFFPALTLDGNYSHSGETVSDLHASSYIGLSLNLPLFTGFDRPSRMKQEKMALGGLGQQKEIIIQEISLEVWDAHLMVKEAAERIDNTRILHENARDNRNIAEGEYREGVGSMLDVIDAQTELVDAEQLLIEALVDHKIAICTLDRVLGRTLRKEIPD